jgi:hypothetical protein
MMLITMDEVNSAMTLKGISEMPPKIRIIPHVGIDGLSLGIERDSVVNILGEPDKRHLTNYEGHGSDDECWGYPKIGIDLTFSGDDNWLLGTIDVQSKDAELAGKCFLGMDENEFLKNIKEAGIEIELDDDFTELGSKNYTCVKLDLGFWIQDGELTAIAIFPKYEDDGDTVIWPE